MGQLIDTSVFVDLERKGLPLKTLAAHEPDNKPVLAAITISELLVGARRADSVSRRNLREQLVDAILLNIPVESFDLEVARTHSYLWAQLTSAGQLVGAHDLQIAATALNREHGVLTYNVRDFSRVPGLEVVEPAW